MHLISKFALAGAALAISATAQAERPILIKEASVMSAGATALTAGAAYEIGREATIAGLGTGEYDNIRLSPLGMRYGLGDGMEVGGYVGFNSNSADDAGAPDEGGLEGITAYVKTALNANVALELGITLAGSDDVLPYPNDGLDFFVNLPMQRRAGSGLLYGQFGYTVKDEVGGFAGDNYFNYGVGYAFPLQTGTTANVELVGDEAPFIQGSYMDLVFGVSTEMAPGTHLSPYASVGLYDNSPDIALGVKFETRI